MHKLKVGDTVKRIHGYVGEVFDRFLEDVDKQPTDRFTVTDLAGEWIQIDGWESRSTNIHPFNVKHFKKVHELQDTTKNEEKAKRYDHFVKVLFDGDETVFNEYFESLNQIKERVIEFSKGGL